jgi:transcription elongation factor Elf1
MPEENQTKCWYGHKKVFVGIRNNVEYFHCKNCGQEWEEKLPTDDPAAQGALVADDNDDT